MSVLADYRTCVFEMVRKIPRGRVMSYKQVASIVGLSNPRHVGRILNTNTNPNLYPCHRVVKSDGSVAAGYAFGGPEKQLEKLKGEGVLFTNNRIERRFFQLSE